jgi:hypothetical protein
VCADQRGVLRALKSIGQMKQAVMPERRDVRWRMTLSQFLLRQSHLLYPSGGPRQSEIPSGHRRSDSEKCGALPS